MILLIQWHFEKGLRRISKIFFTACELFFTGLAGFSQWISV
jgi:hypothetical protein